MADPAQSYDFTSFPGFDSPRQNWFKMPNEWIEICADISSVAEIKVVQYVMRHTWGHQEYGIRKRISLDEFMNGRRRKDGSRMDRGTGLSKPSVISGLRSAIERGFLIEEIDDSDKARVKKFYSLRMMPGSSSDEIDEDAQASPEEERGVKHLDADVKKFYPGVKSFDSEGKETLHRSEKETTERHLEKETNKNNNSDASQEPVAKPNEDVVVALNSRGIAKGVATKLSQEHPADYVQAKIEYHDFLLDERPEDIKKPAAWLRRAIEDDYEPPDGFISPKERERQAAEEKRRIEAAHAAREREAERQRTRDKEREKAREAAREKLRREYNTPEELEREWGSVLEDIRITGQDSLYGLLASSQALTVTDGVLDVAVDSSFHAQQLSHPNTLALLKRTIKRVTKQTYDPHFVLVESIA
mgnify:CR=1 FL=1